MTDRLSALSAVMVAPDRTLAAQFTVSSAGRQGFQVLLDLKTYPSEQTLNLRIRQLHPEVVLLDVASDLSAALNIVSYLSRTSPEIGVVALDRQSDSETILRTLRSGAREFLYAPFDPANTAEAVARLLRLRMPTQAAEKELGSVAVFSSVKPGSGASTLSAQVAFALKRLSTKRVLLADFDLMGGTLGYYLRLNSEHSLMDAMENCDNLDGSRWTSLLASSNGVDILPAPVVPCGDNIDTSRLQMVLEYARSMYDWTILDLPVVFQRTSLMTLSQCEQTFLVSTPELPSLHLARRSITMLDQLGFPKERFSVLINRVSKRSEITRSDMEKLFDCRVYASLPNDYFSLHRAVTIGEPLAGSDDLSRAIGHLAGRLCASRPNGTAVTGGAK